VISLVVIAAVLEVMEMVSCEIPEEHMLPNPVHIKIKKPDLHFDEAQGIAKDRAEAHYSGAMLLSWYDRKKGSCSPRNVEGCSEEKPGWVEYAESRGGNLTIDINNEEYVFVFRGEQALA